MTRLNIAELLLASAAVLGLVGCGDSAGTPPDSQTADNGGNGSMNGTGGSSSVDPTTGGENTSGAPPAGAVALVPDDTGWVDGSTNNLGIQGAWYSYNDCADSPGDCTMNHLPAEGEFPNDNGKMCTSGTTAVVASEAEFSTKWGAGIALDLNSPGGTEPSATYDANANGVTGFSFTITGTAPGLRVNVKSAPAGDDSHFEDVGVGQNNVSFSQVEQGSWVMNPSPLDTSQLLAIQFQIPSKMDEAVPFDYCVENFAALTD